MSSNKLKIIACISMLVDHIGFILLPQVTVLRAIGRIAMPIFAFFIAEGCRYTKNKLKYFLQIFLLGIACQSVYFINDLITGSVSELYFNILITFSFSVIICFAYLELEKAFIAKDKIISKLTVFISAILFALAFLRFSDNVIGIPVSVDYGVRGILLPLSAIIFRNKHLRIMLFSICLIGFMIYYGKGIYTIICTSLAIPLLYLYNGTYGTKKLKYLFYIFYPTHLALLYLIKILI